MIDAIETPALLLETAHLDRNLARMQRRAEALGVRLRPHAKTHKCLQIVRRQLALGAQGITVSTLKEADFFHAAGVDDILYAVGIAPNKFEHAMRLARAGCRLTVLVDSVAAAVRLAAFGRESCHRFDVMIEIDTDGHRSGVQCDDPRLLEIGAALAAEGARLAGIMTHAGGSYDLCEPRALEAHAERERARCVEAAERLRAAGHPCAEVSVGSTPTALAATSLHGVTEFRPGVYAFFDLVIAGIGVCEPRDIAISVMTSVIGHRPDRRWVLIDAGWMAMSRDRSTAAQARDWGYGLVCDAAGAPLDSLRYVDANQEHGILEARAPVDVERDYPIGTLLRILPNHACATAAQFPSYVALEPGSTPERWDRVQGW